MRYVPLLLAVSMAVGAAHAVDYRFSFWSPASVPPERFCAEPDQRGAAVRRLR